MASANIPESIVGTPLFVPSANNFFSIETAGLPNGEDCLKVLGGTNRDYKAYVAAQTLSPAIFTDRLSGWSVSFWFKGGNITPAGSGYRADEMLFGVMTAAWNADWTTAANATGVVWTVTHWSASGGSSCGIGLMKPKQQINPAGNATAQVGAAITPNVWHLITIYSGADGTPTMAIDNAAAANGSNGASGQIGIAGSQFFSIGAYSDQPNMNGRQGDWYLGKLAFHDHALNLTERQLLYNSMT